jgi:hypothetical protein
MTTTPVFTPNKGFTPLQWRGIHSTPPNVRLDVGPYCPLDDTHLQVRLDGWTCPVCTAAWDFHGFAGYWLPLDAVTSAPVTPRWSAPLAVAAVCAPSAGVLTLLAGVDHQAQLADVDTDLVLLAAAVLAVIGVLIVAGAWVVGYVERALMSARNEVTGTTTELGLAPHPRVAAAQLRAMRGAR